jgi:hypothetical protein
LLVLCLNMLSGCDGLRQQAPSYREAWPQPKRTFIGSDYWANDLADWQVSGGQVHAHPGAYRSLVLLTQAADADSGTLHVSVLVDMKGLGRVETPDHYVGIRLGLQHPTGDYRAAVTHSQGLDLGLTARGELFIGDPAQAEAISPLDMDVTWELRVQAHPQGDTYRLTLAVHEQYTGRRLEILSRDSVPKQAIQGHLALVSHVIAPDSVADSLLTQPVISFDDWQVGGTLLRAHPERAYGPILFARHSIDRQTLLLAAQLAPVNLTFTHLVKLEIDQGEGFELLRESAIDPQTLQATFQLSPWQPTQAVPYRLSCQLDTDSGLRTFVLLDTLAALPSHDAPLTLATLGTPIDAGSPYPALIEAIRQESPDLIIGDLPRPLQPLQAASDPSPQAKMAYLDQWYRFGWMMAPLWQQIPSILRLPPGTPTTLLPWLATIQTAAHPPSPQIATATLAGGYTSWHYAGLSLCLLDDRFTEASHPLGAKQLAFFQQWTRDWSSHTQLKLALSTYAWTADAAPPSLTSEVTRGQSSPTSPWHAAIQTLREGLALHVVSPQGTPAVHHYGLQQANDAGFVFVPPGLHQPQDSLHAPSNHLAVPSYSLIRLDPQLRIYRLEVLPLPGRPAPSPSRQTDWPFQVHQSDNYGATPVAWLPPVAATGPDWPVVQVIREDNQTVVYTRRLDKRPVILPVFEAGSYTLRVFDPEGSRQQSIQHIHAETQQGQGKTIQIDW